MRRPVLICLLTLIGIMLLNANEAPFSKDPAISPDGSQVCFVFDNDLWILPFEGGNAVRLTSTPASEWGPQWSPDGKYIAFNSNREGANYPYIIPVTGGIARPIIREGYNVVEWYLDSQSLLVSRYSPRFGTSYYKLGIDGSRPLLLAEIGDSFATLSPDQKSIIFNRYGDPHREAYTGSLSGNLWKIDLDTKQYTKLTDTKYSVRYPRFATSSGALFYCQSDGKSFQLMRAEKLDFGKAKQLSNLPQFSARDINVARKNERVVFEHFDQIWKYDPLAKGKDKVMLLEVNIPEDSWVDTRRFEKAQNNVWQYAVSGDGVFLGLQYKYDAFLRPKAGGEPRRITFDQTGISNMVFLEDNRSMILQKMDHGKEKLYRLRVENPQQLEEITWDGSDSLSVDNFYQGAQNLWVLHYSTPRMGGQIAIADSGFVNIRPINAPKPVLSYRLGINADASWAVYSAIREDYTRELWLYEFATGTHTKLMNDYGWSDNFMWTSDNRSIIFSQSGGIARLDLLPRDEFELDKDYWAEALEVKEPKPAPEPEQEPEPEPEQPRQESLDTDEPDAQEVPTAQKTPSPLEIYWPGLQNRVYTIISGSNAQLVPLRAKADSTFYYISNGYYYNAPTTLNSANIYGQNVREEQSFGMNVWGLKEQGSNIFYYIIDGMLYSHAVGGSRKQIPVSFEYEWDESTLNTRVFEEAWGVFGDRFYDPDMHGRDWKAMYNLYLPYAQKARSIDDIGVIVDEMIGDLNASHTGFYPRREGGMQYRSIANLGLEFDLQARLDRGIRIALVYPDTRLDQVFKLQAGDLLTHIDGVEIKGNTSIDSLLTDKIGKRIYLSLERDGEKLKADIKGLSSSELRRLEYARKINTRRQLVNRLTNNQVGYIHIPAMGETDYNTFVKELYRDNMDKKALIIDVRGNVGGRIHDQLISLLIKRQYATTTSRRWQYTPTPEPYRVWDRPSIVLVDEHSFSDGEIFPVVYKELKLGKVVGYPSSGAVIGTTEYELLDGSTMRLPGSGWYKMDGANMEGSGAMPDIIIENTPNDIIAGRDPQLERAINEILKDIK